MSKKRQTRNTKKMQKALGSKRSRAGYQTGGTVKKYEGVAADRQQELDNYFKSNKNLSSLGSHKNPYFQEAPAAAKEPEIKPAPAVAVQEETTTSVNPRLNLNNNDNEFDSTNGYYNPITGRWMPLPDNNNNTGGFMPGAAPPKKTEAPIGLDPGRPDPVILPEVKVEKVEEGPASETLQMDAVAPATAGTAQATEAVAETTGPAALAEAPTPVEAATYEAALAEALPKGEAAQGKVSEEAIAKFVPGTLTQAPEAVKRDSGQEQAVFSRYCYIYYFK
jgi:hypothetical protein